MMAIIDTTKIALIIMFRHLKKKDPHIITVYWDADKKTTLFLDLASWVGFQE